MLTGGTDEKKKRGKKSTEEKKKIQWLIWVLKEKVLEADVTSSVTPWIQTSSVYTTSIL